MSRLLLSYNPLRGGFLLQLDSFDRSKHKKFSIADGLIDSYLSPEPRLLALESTWPAGGLFLHGPTEPLVGTFLAEGPTHEIKTQRFSLRQDQDLFSLWFTAPPTIGGPSFVCQREGTTRTSLWFSDQWQPMGPPDKRPKFEKGSEIMKGDKARCLAGIQCKFSGAAATYPIESIEFVVNNK